MPKNQATNHPYDKLSDRQRQILEFIENFLAQEGYPPTIRQIGEAVDIPSTSVVNYNLNKLVREGLLERSEKVSRGLRLIRDVEEDVKASVKNVRRVMDSVFSIPLAGQIVASRPVEFFGTHQDEDEVVDVPASLLGTVPVDQVYALSVSGNSMIDAMVGDGDLVILRRQETADNGDMVAALIDGHETTLKHFYKEGRQVRLQPANPEMDPIYVDANRVEIQGRVLAVMRSL
jgi:repressor LexA